MQEEILKKVTDFLALAKELNYDLVALYEKEPMMMQVVGATAVGLTVLLMILRSSMKKSGANKALKNMLNENNDFEDFQANLDKILKVLPSAKPDFIATLKENKERYIEAQLKTLDEEPLDIQIEKYQRMARTYSNLAQAARDEELAEFYEQNSHTILDERLNSKIKEYMSSFEFNDESVAVLEAIINYANNQDEPQTILNIVKDALNSFDFGSSLEVYNFVKSLDAEALGELYDFFMQKQEELFTKADSVVAGEILEELLNSDEREKVLEYIKNLKVATYLQELKYKYFSQTDDFEFDLAFIANPTPITQNYANYLESKLTANWRDSEYLEDLINRENVTNVIGHDRARLVIQRVDELRAAKEEKQKLEDVVKLAKEAKELAQEAKEIALQNSKKEEDQEVVDTESKESN